MITFKNGKAFGTKSILGGTANYQSAERETMDIIIPAENITLEEAKAIWQDPEATSEITITYKEEVEGQAVERAAVHLNFTIPMALTLDTYNGVECVHIRLAQMSALEIAQAKQAQDMDDVNAALCELAELVAGGEDDG